MLKIAFDIGGVLSKYPTEFTKLIDALGYSAEIFVITDMHDKQEVLQVLKDNGFKIADDHVFCADYNTHGEMCKAVLLKELEIDIFFDDFIGYTAWDSTLGEAPIRLLVCPDAWRPYWHRSWKTDAANFGRKHYFKQ